MQKKIAKTTKGKGRNYLSVKEGAGMTEAGRKAYNKANNSNLKPPAPNPKTEKDKARKKSFCARSQNWDGERGLAARRRWKC
jgi:ribosomal protein L34